MPRELIAQARTQAVLAESPLRAAALLHIARVLTALNPQEAEEVFDEGLAQIAVCADMDRRALQEEACIIAAAVAPKRVPGLITGRPPRDFVASRVIDVMMDHGNVDSATSFLLTEQSGAGYPFGSVSRVLQSCSDEARQLEILRHSIEIWRNEPNDGLLQVFARHWQLLPPEEALQRTRQIVETVVRQPDRPVNATMQGIHFSSMQEFSLFQILHVLRHVDGQLAESLLEQRTQLAAAAARYPSGMESILGESRKPQAPGGSGGGYAMGGSPDDFPYLLALMNAQSGGDFDAVFAEALEFYAKDTDPARPNRAVRECWPSTQAFREIVYRAGKMHGARAATYLDRIPDPDVRLLAQIEFAAALAGLPQWTGTRRQYRPSIMRSSTTTDPDTGTRVRDDEHTGPKGPRIRCPRCKWSPGPADVWSCTCGHVWNTFDTGGVCPECLHQWTTTQCLSCHQWSAHSDWYVY